MSGFYAAIGSLGTLPGRDRVLGVGRTEAIALEDARQGALADPDVPRRVYALVELTPAQHSRVLCGELDAVELGLAPPANHQHH
jgi:hypothetical protein